MMEQDTVYTRNPWTDDDRSLGRVKDVLFLCERTGHLDHQVRTSASGSELGYRARKRWVTVDRLGTGGS